MAEGVLRESVSASRKEAVSKLEARDCHDDSAYLVEVVEDGVFRGRSVPRVFVGSFGEVERPVDDENDPAGDRGPQDVFVESSAEGFQIGVWVD